MKTYSDHGEQIYDAATGAAIPKDIGNRDWQRVLAEVAEGTAHIAPPALPPSPAA